MLFRNVLASSVLAVCLPVAAQEEKKIEIGSQAPDFTATDINDKPFKLSDRAGQDKNIILMFSRANW
jgi:hypothetical protein